MEPDAATAGSGVFFLFVLLLVGFGFYFLPSIVGQLRGAKAKNQVWVVNFFLGWTGIGWVVALVMAVGEKAVVAGQPAGPPTYGTQHPPSELSWVETPRRRRRWPPVLLGLFALLMLASVMAALTEGNTSGGPTTEPIAATTTNGSQGIPAEVRAALARWNGIPRAAIWDVYDTTDCPALAADITYALQTIRISDPVERAAFTDNLALVTAYRASELGCDAETLVSNVRRSLTTSP